MKKIQSGRILKEIDAADFPWIATCDKKIQSGRILKGIDAADFAWIATCNKKSVLHPERRHRIEGLDRLRCATKNLVPQREGIGENWMA
jgi:hypothetical protein